VVLDNESGIAALVSHLHREHGRTRFLHLAGPEASTDAAERRAAFVAAVYRLPGCSGQSVAGDFDRETARHSVECLLAANPVGRPSFDAIVAADDESAVGALQALRSAGLRVPEDVSLTGFDDQSYAAMIHPALSTVRSPSGDLGRSAVELLLAQVAHRAAAPTTRIATSLVFRESCGCSAIAPPSGAILP
jgi:LacI family transcriptional regulator